MGYVLNQKGLSTLSSASPKSGVWYDTINNRLWTVDGSNIKVVTFDGSSFTEVSTGTRSCTGPICSDGTYVYITTSSVLIAYSYTPTTLTSITSIAASGATSLYCDSSGYVYVSATTGIFTYSFNGSTFTPKTTFGSTGFSAVTGNGTYLFATNTNSNTLYALSYDGVSYTTLGSTITTNYGTCLTWDGSYVVVGFTTDKLITAYSFNGSSFSTVGSSYVCSYTPRAIAYDGIFYYVSCYTSGSAALEVLSFNGSSFTQVGYFNAIGYLYPHTVTVGNGYCFASNYNYTMLNSVIAVKMNLTAQFTANTVTGNAPLTVNFTSL